MEDDDYSTIDSSSESTTTTPAASDGILMLSLPDSLAEDEPHTDDDKSSGDHDVFETPPEYALVGTSQEKTPVIDFNQVGYDDDEDRDFDEVGGIGDGSGVIVAVGGCGEEVDGAVDLSRDLDLVVSQKELMELRVSKRDLASTAESSPPSKKLRVSEHDLGESQEELETERLSLSNLSSNSDHTLEIAGDDAKSVEEGKKNVEDSGSETENADEDTQPITEESGGSSSVEFSYQEGGGESDTGDSQVFRVLPLSFRPSAELSGMRAEESSKWSFLLDVLKLLKGKAGEECDEIEKCSFVEIAKRRGMTFPRVPRVLE